MKKVIFSALTFFLLSSVVLFAQDVEQDRPATTQEQDQPVAYDSQEMKTEVQLQELPEAVTSTLNSEEYQEWTATSSYIVNDENNEENTSEQQYAVELQKDEETKTVYFDSQGNKVDKEEDLD